MKFTVSSKALKNVTSLGIIKANISQFYYRSNVAQITATQDALKINIEASGIMTEMTLKGSGDEDTTKSVMIECAKFKNLIDSIDNDIITLEFIEGGIYVHAGRSKFAIPQLMDTNDAQLNAPNQGLTRDSVITIKPEDWQFVKDHQMYAISKSEKRPVYKNVWVGENKELIVGDMDISLFTYSNYGEFDTTCLLPPSLINLFISIPEGARIARCGRTYLLEIETDSYSMVTEFTPKYEDDETVGSYNAKIILSKLVHPENFVTVDISSIIKFINQASIVNQADVGKITEFIIADNQLTLNNRTNSCSMEVTSSENYQVNFATEFLKRVLSGFDADQVNIAPMYGNMVTPDGQQIQRVIGCIFWTEKLTAILAGQG